MRRGTSGLSLEGSFTRLTSCDVPLVFLSLAAQQKAAKGREKALLASLPTAEAEAEGRAKADREIAAIVSDAKASGARRRLAGAIQGEAADGSSDGAPADEDADAAGAEGAEGSDADRGRAMGLPIAPGDHRNGAPLSTHVAMTSADHLRHSVFADLHNSLFDWMPATSSKDYGTKTYVKHTTTAGPL
jgi:hypothetical protein